MKVIVSKGSGPAQLLQARGRGAGQPGLGGRQERLGDDGRVWGFMIKRGDLKEKRGGALLGGKAKAQIRQKVLRTPAPATNPIPRAL